jgi:hypothetical protein
MFNSSLFLLGADESEENKRLFEPYDGVFLPQFFGWRDGEPGERLSNVWRFTTAALSKDTLLALVSQQDRELTTAASKQVGGKARSRQATPAKKVLRALFAGEAQSATTSVGSD